jgi:ankyrin repeat protein
MEFPAVQFGMEPSSTTDLDVNGCTESLFLGPHLVLHRAVISGLPLEEILRDGTDVNLANDDGVTPLHLAMRSACGPSVALRLMQAGALVTSQTRAGNSALILLAICDGPDDEDGETKAVFLLNNGACVNSANITGDTPLHYAAKHKRCFLFERLLN